MRGTNREQLTADARAAVPDGYALTSLSLNRDGAVDVVAKIEALSLERREVRANGADYETARAALLAQFDAEEWQLLSVRQAL